MPNARETGTDKIPNTDDTRTDKIPSATQKGPDETANRHTDKSPELYRQFNNNTSNKCYDSNPHEPRQVTPLHILHTKTNPCDNYSFSHFAQRKQVCVDANLRPSHARQFFMSAIASTETNWGFAPTKTSFRRPVHQRQVAHFL